MKKDIENISRIETSILIAEKIRTAYPEHYDYIMKNLIFESTEDYEAWNINSKSISNLIYLSYKIKNKQFNIDREIIGDYTGYEHDAEIE